MNNATTIAQPNASTTANATANAAAPLTELYSVREAAKVFGMTEARLRYWMQTGIVAASVRQGGRFYYTFRDLVMLKAARDMMAAQLSMPAMRKHLLTLAQLLRDLGTGAHVRVCCDGETLVAVQGDRAYDPPSGKIMVAFSLASLREHVAETLSDREGGGSGAGGETDGVPAYCEDQPTDLMSVGSAYNAFVDGMNAEAAGDHRTAEHKYQHALAMQPNFTAAMTNLGNIRYAQGDGAAARKLYQQVLALEPDHPEARFNLATVLEDAGELEHAISELRRVCGTTPAFADAHYNLGLLLTKLGSKKQAQRCFERYLEFDASSPWAAAAMAAAHAVEGPGRSGGAKAGVGSRPTGGGDTTSVH